MKMGVKSVLLTRKGWRYSKHGQSRKMKGSNEISELEPRGPREYDRKWGISGSVSWRCS
jgi:hypothetical protein